MCFLIYIYSVYSSVFQRIASPVDYDNKRGCFVDFAQAFVMYLYTCTQMLDGAGIVTYIYPQKNPNVG